MLLPALLAYTAEEQDKFTRLYTLYYSQLYHFALSRLQSVPDAQDALQEAFGRVLNHLDDITEIHCSKTRGFLFIIVKRECIRIYRRNRREREHCETPGEEEWANCAGDDPTWQQVEPRMAVEEILRRLRTLPEDDQELFLFKHYYGFSYRELAGLFGMSEKNVSVRLSRIRQRLVKALGKEGKSNGEQE